MAEPNPLFVHATESPYGSTIGSSPEPDRSIYKAKQIADFILCGVKNGRDLRVLDSIVRNHGLFENYPVPSNVHNLDEIYSFNCVLAVADLYYQFCFENLATEAMLPAYYRCVHAVNALTYYLQVPHGGQNRLPAPVALDKGERWKLDRTWDICVCLLGAIKVWCGFDRKLLIDDQAIVHDVHYRRAATKAVDLIRAQGKGRVCPRTLGLLVREEVPPFVQPMHLIRKLQYDQPIEAGRFNHWDCSADICRFDNMDGPSPLHVPGCVRDTCNILKPLAANEAQFDQVLRGHMPAVNVAPWPVQRQAGFRGWVGASHRTLAVSHVWGDGVFGTRDEGLNQCVHKKLADIANYQGCDSYWIDCATIPQEPQATRNAMIQKINLTFREAGTVLCWDEGFANLVSNDPDVQLLSLIISHWHRRAWTLLEGNRAKLDNTKFLQWNKRTQPPSHRLFSLKDTVISAFQENRVPLWIQSALVELLPYSDATMSMGDPPNGGARMSMDAAGLLLSGRHATRLNDAETIWGLFRPAEGLNGAGDISFDDPYLYAGDQVDVAFISSNAARHDALGTWKPGRTNASVWVRTAYGGVKATIRRDRNRQVLVGDWWFKEGLAVKGMVDWGVCVKGVDARLQERLRSTEDRYKCALICPILRADPRKCPQEVVRRHSIDPIQGFFTTNVAMQCARAIFITQRTDQEPWQWGAIVNLKAPVSFTTSEMGRFEIGTFA
ncbi:HET domain protein [Aspergillus candidus]|uniref:Heterokaryon incompatibility domain-containing protein n=1 Tax=Aspergillus candidus TaxID=41067 RepID=A0A2I2F840_ASPCN|nr:hypothetical protein BDW47DRAFT_126944 [Aspergillus candidus]PLB36804.1 hypothetical protein BDW47DRAFT_126944 [Aspergillus candidus]